MKKLLLFATIIAFAFHSNAQMNNWRMSYDVAIPLGQMSDDFISKSSWRGISIDSRWALDDHITVGFLVGWQVFAQRFDNYTQVLDNGNAALHGRHFRFINTFPIQANAHYSFGSEFGTRPWVGMAFGTAFSDQRTQVGFYQFNSSFWSLTFTPQAGIDLPIDHTRAFSFSLRYNYFLHSNQPFNYSFLVIGTGFKFSFM